MKATPLTSPALLTIADIAALDRVSIKTVRRWITTGDLIAHRLGSQWRIAPADHELFLRARRGLNLPRDGVQ